MMQSYVDYWKENKPACVGLSRIGRGRYSECLSSGQSRDCSIFWSLFPRSWISYNSRGITFKIFRDKHKPSVTFKDLL